MQIISLHPVKTWQGMNLMSISAPWVNSLKTLAFPPVRKLGGIKPIDLSDSWFKYHDIIVLYLVFIRAG